MRIYLSSTSQDLKEHRRAVLEAIRRADFDCSAMEDYAASDQRPVEFCLQDVARCDFYIGVFAHRYGFIPEGFDRSITELEYRKAKETGKPTLVFLAEANFAGIEFEESIPSKEKLQTLKSELQANY